MLRIDGFEYHRRRGTGAMARLARALRRVAVKPIELYQRFFSSNLPPVCRYVPSCSEYARHAILKYGFFRGVLFGAVRIARCNPLFPGGYDPLV